MDTTLLLIGGSNVDYIATSKDKLIKKVSNIGTVSISFGGVMRNIAENLARLGNKVDFITAIGNDTNGIAMKSNLNSLGINVISPDSSYPTGSYVAINDSNHDMVDAICDNRIIKDLNLEFIKKNAELIESHEYIILDSNLEETTIDYLFEAFKNKKFIVEAISPTKVIKYKKHLDEIFLIKCNIHEARMLMGIDLVEKDLVSGLLARGVKNVVVSHGAKDIYFGQDVRKVDLVKVEEVFKFENTTGCGDALTSGVIDYFFRGHTLKESVSFGNELSRLTLMSKGATSIEVEKYAHN